MIKIIQPEVREVAEWFCDKHNNVPAYFQVTMEGGYGSGYDCQTSRLQLCDECAEKAIKLLMAEFGDAVKFE